MKPHGCVALAALVASGCLGLPGQTGPAAVHAIERYPAVPKVACASRVAPPPAGCQASAKATENGLGSDLLPIPAPPTVESPPPAQAGSTIADRGEIESGDPPVPKAPARPEPSAPRDPSSGIVEASEPPAPLEPVIATAEVDATAPSPLIAAAAVDATAPPPSAVPARSGPSKPKGRPVASVGDEIISLPELTRATKARLDQFGPGVGPNRRQVIAIARETLKSMVVRSLVSQEALAKLGGPERLGELEARLGQTWADRELPGLLRREGVATEGELRVRLARRLTTPEVLRDEFVVRSVAAELILLDRLDLDLDAYLDVLRKRRTITSIMTPAELMAAGRQSAMDEPSGR